MVQKSVRRARYHHGDLRRALLDAAVTAIAQVGIEGLTLKQLAQQLGVTHAAPYRHFKDKQALLDEVAAIGFERLSQRMQRAFEAEHASARAQFLATGFAVVEFAVKHPGYYRTMFFGHMGSTLRALANAPPDTAFRRLLGYVEAWQRAGLLQRKAPITLALTIWPCTHGLACLCMSGQLRSRSLRALRELADQTHASLLDGVGR